MPAVARKLLTAEEFFKLPDPIDGSKQELVNGMVIAMAPAGSEHAEIQFNVALLLKAYLKCRKTGEQWESAV